MAVRLDRNLEVAEVARWFDAEKDKEIIMRKWMAAKKETIRCSDPQKAQSLWLELCDMLREVHSSVTFVSESLDAHIEAMKELEQQPSVVQSSTADQAADLGRSLPSTAGKVDVGGKFSVSGIALLFFLLSILTLRLLFRR